MTGREEMVNLKIEKFVSDQLLFQIDRRIS
jgi:hypothetical protein